MRGSVERKVKADLDKTKAKTDGEQDVAIAELQQAVALLEADMDAVKEILKLEDDEEKPKK